MLAAIILQNYRAFERHRIEFRPLTIAVAKNNAGKSTVIEALRLISLVTQSYRGLSFRQAPEAIELGIHYVGVSPSLKHLDLVTDSLFHRERLLEAETPV